MHTAERGSCVVVSRQTQNTLSPNTHLRIVVLPHAACDLVATQVEGLEVDARQLQLLAGGVLRRLVLYYTVVLQHVHERGLAGVVQAQEQDLGVLVVQAVVCGCSGER